MSVRASTRARPPSRTSVTALHSRFVQCEWYIREENLRRPTTTYYLQLNAPCDWSLCWLTVLGAGSAVPGDVPRALVAVTLTLLAFSHATHAGLGCARQANDRLAALGTCHVQTPPAPRSPPRAPYVGCR